MGGRVAAGRKSGAALCRGRWAGVASGLSVRTPARRERPCSGQRGEGGVWRSRRGARWRHRWWPGVSAPGSGWSASASVTTGPRHGGQARPELQQRLDAVVAAGAPGVVALVNEGRRGWRDDGEHGWGSDRAVWQSARGVADLRDGAADASGRSVPGGQRDEVVCGDSGVAAGGGGPAVALGQCRALASRSVAVWRPGDGAPAAQPHQRRTGLLVPTGHRAPWRQPLAVLAAAGARGARRRPAAGLPCRDGVVVLEHRLRAGGHDHRTRDGP